MENVIVNTFANHRSLLDRTEKALGDTIILAADRISKAIAEGGKVLIAGNGGSAADAQHISAELVGRFSRERRGFPVIALTCDTSILTALSNDYGFDHVFRRQVEALACPGDIVLLISTSGNSANLSLAAEEALRRGAVLIALLGKGGGELGKIVDSSRNSVNLVVPSDETPRIQEMHCILYHIICDLVEESLMASDGGEK
ncbi:MAG: phosphoheptose isomerase [Candidatus Wallbacteria bacterium HGW-Wallbacteria-1]|uniref:Phosphoheptose isomerase n=1 Tax=Candidatus Wallbacteria bacterium HGW-Wallbacteria-1 TaxID=2013854 RepID=A0A2N1PMI1_9BACT|nr:MAG: phosphoheptose isomerase [Candidatus Wallbacteria bacterium HGW-Wallbacteria-1]